jgi:molybdopterin-guanine dinucleotide biosynthesis protein A
MQRGAIILCGGTNRRMGSDKAWLPFGPDEVMLQRVARLISQVVPTERIVCVAATKQRLPPLADGVRVVQDQHPQRGPLEGLAAGLTALSGEVEAVSATSCDVPLLVPALIERLFSLLDGDEIVVPQQGRFLHPLAGVYRMSVLPTIVRRLAANQLRLHDLLDACQTQTVPVATLRDVDPTLSSLAGCNNQAEYQQALLQAGFTQRGDPS